MLAYFYLLFCTFTFILAQENPGISHLSQDHVMNLGDSLDLECSVSNVDDCCTVSWSKQNLQRSDWPVPLSAGELNILKDTRFNTRYVQYNKTFILHISELQETDEGFYKCQINEGFDVIVAAEVKVLIRRPAVILSNSTLSVDTAEGANVKLECYAGGYPEPTIYWTRANNGILHDGHTVYKGNILYINVIRKEDEGLYHCGAENGIPPSVRHNIYVEVRSLPLDDTE